MCCDGEKVKHLVDVDLAGFALLRLGDHDAEDTVLQASADGLLIDPNGETERSRELAYAPLRDPVFGFGLLWLLLLLGVGDLGLLVLGTLIFDGGFVAVVVVWLAALGDGAGSFGGFDEARRRCAGGVGTFCPALDGDGLIVGEFNLDILLFDAWKIAVELISVWELLYVELGIEGLQSSASVLLVRVLVAVEVIEQAEEGCE